MSIRKNRNDINNKSQELASQLEGNYKRTITYDEKKFSAVREFVETNVVIHEIINDLYGDNKKYITLAARLPCLMIRPIKAYIDIGGDNIDIKSSVINDKFIIEEQTYNERNEFYKSMLIDNITQTIYYNVDANDWGYYIKNLLRDIVIDNESLFSIYKHL